MVNKKRGLFDAVRIDDDRPFVVSMDDSKGKLESHLAL